MINKPRKSRRTIFLLYSDYQCSHLSSTSKECAHAEIFFVPEDERSSQSGDLAALIVARGNARRAAAEDLFASLEAKYGGGGAKTGKKKKEKAPGGAGGAVRSGGVKKKEVSGKKK